MTKRQLKLKMSELRLELKVKIIKLRKQFKESIRPYKKAYCLKKKQEKQLKQDLDNKKAVKLIEE